IGRIPVKTSRQLQSILDRIIQYEKASPAAWMRKALFVADSDPYFEAINEQLALNNMPANYRADFFNRSDGKDANIIIDKVNAGTAFTIYIGHGNITSWNGLLDISDLANLKSSNRPTFLLTLECWNGYFSNPIEEGFSEEFLRAAGGSIGCLTPVGTGYPYEHRAIAQYFLNGLFSDNNTVLGSAAYAAKLKAYTEGSISEDTFWQYIYLGDPATHFHVCAFHLLAPADRSAVGSNTVFTWNGDGFSNFTVQFSTTPDFNTWETIPVFTFKNQYFPTPLVWFMLNAMAQQNNQLWWRVGGIDRQVTFTRDMVIDFQREISYTQPQSFSIAQ
ncbi:MAG: C25 family cysteine peptidase, partial [Pseudomonadota bacterium]